MSEWKETDIGLIPHDWDVIRFREILSSPLRNGVNKPSKVRGVGNYKMVNMNEIFAHDVIYDIPMEFVELNENEKETSLLEKFDLLFARQSLVFEGAGKCSIYLGADEKVCFEGHLIRARLDPKKSSPKFYYYFFSSSYGKRFIRTITEQAVVAGIRGSDLKELQVPYPSKKEQDGVSAILSCLDLKIENLRKQNETLERIAQNLFKHWFVDFEFPDEDGKLYKSSGGAMERSKLGEIPVGWQLLELGDVAINHSETHKFKNKTHVVFINTGDVLEGDFLHQEYSPIDSLPGQAKKQIRKDDILYSEIRPINRRFAYVNFSENLHDYVVSTKFMVVRSNEKILPRLLYLILKRDSTIQEFHHIADSRSGTFPQITFESVSKFPIVLPDIKLQKQLMNVITPLLEKKEFNIQKIQTLVRTRDMLLPQLMSGKLRIQGDG